MSSGENWGTNKLNAALGVQDLSGDEDEPYNGEDGQ